MSNLNRNMPSNSNKANSASSQFMSLADILQAKTSSVRTRSGDKIQLGLDLKKNLDSIHPSTSKLNISRALDQVASESFNFVDINAERLNQTEANNTNGPISAQVNSHQLQNERHPRGGRRAVKKEDKLSLNLSSYNAYGDPLEQIKKLTKEIDSRSDLKCFDFDDKDNDRYSKVKPAGFELVQLPKDFNVERGRLNLYKSGMIEVITQDNPPKVMRFKPTIHNINNVCTDLVIATDVEVYLDKTKVFTSQAEE